MCVMKILIDGHEFHAGIDAQNATPEQLKAWAEKWRSKLSKLVSISIELTDGSFLVLGEAQLSRAVFVFAVTGT